MKRLADVMTERQWFQITARKSTEFPGVCLAVGLNDVAKGRELVDANARAVTIIRRLWPERIAGHNCVMDPADQDWCLVSLFNDHPQTTWADVEKVIREFDAEEERA